MKIKNVLVVYTNPKNLAEKQILHVVEKTLKKYKVDYTISERKRLHKKLFRNRGLVIAVGGDGGRDHQKLENYLHKNQIKNFLITGYIKEPATRDLYTSFADVVVLPNTSKDKVSKLYTSPLKMFEYMVSRRPIVASNLPSLREVLNEKNAMLVRPDSAADLAEGIRVVLADQAQAHLLSEQAFKDVQKYTWQKRAKMILSA